MVSGPWWIAYCVFGIVLNARNLVRACGGDLALGGGVVLIAAALGAVTHDLLKRAGLGLLQRGWAGVLVMLASITLAMLQCALVGEVLAITAYVLFILLALEHDDTPKKKVLALLEKYAPKPAMKARPLF